MPQTITHVSFSTAGGAGSVARILSNEQRSQGRNSTVVSKIAGNLRKAPLSAPLHTIAAGLDEYVVKNRDFDAPISLLRDKIRGLEGRAVFGSEVIHLHGINGALRLDDLQDAPANTRIVWTLHDMNPFSGTCHYSLGCQGFTNSCAECPAVSDVFHHMVSKNLLGKAAALSKIPQLSIVTPSQWLADEARRSSVFRSHSISVIHNPVDPIFFQESAREEASIHSEQFRVAVVAKNLSDPRKQVALAVQAFRSALPHIRGASLTLVGSGGREFEGPGTTLAGNVPPSQLAQVLATSDVLIVPSRAENAPLVIGEAAASGCTPLVAGVGGMSEMVSALDHGGIFHTLEELTSHLITLSGVEDRSRRRNRDKLRNKAELLYSPSAVVEKYDRVYSEQ